MASEAPKNEINLGELSLEQLDSLKNQLEQEIRQFTVSYSGLKDAQARFRESKIALDSFTPENSGKEILVPVTSSMFIPGHISDIEKVMVDIGTGYFVEKKVDDAQDFMERKVTFLETNIKSLQELIDGKRENLEGVIMVMQHKLRLKEEAESAQTK